MNNSLFRQVRFVVPALVLGAFLFSVSDLSGQTTRRRRTSTPIPAPTATPPLTEPQIISRADEFPDENSRAIPPDPNENKPGPGADTASVKSL